MLPSKGTHSGWWITFFVVANVQERADIQLHLESLPSFEGPTIKHLIGAQWLGFLANEDDCKANKQVWRASPNVMAVCWAEWEAKEKGGRIEEDREGQHGRKDWQCWQRIEMIWKVWGRKVKRLGLGWTSEGFCGPTLRLFLDRGSWQQIFSVSFHLGVLMITVIFNNVIWILYYHTPHIISCK